MPRIQDYQTKTSTSDGLPQGRRAPTESFNPGASIAGGFKDFGNAVGILLQSAEQEEVSNVNVAVSKAYEETQKDLLEQRKNGTLNSEEFIKNSFEKRFDENVRPLATTPAAQNYYKKIYAQLHSEASVSAIKAQYDLKGEKAVQNFQDAMVADGNIVRSSPSQYDALNRKAEHTAEAMIASGVPADVVPKLMAHRREYMAKQEMEGWAQLSPDKAKDILDKGLRDDVLGPNAKEELYGKIHSYKVAAFEDEERMRRRQEEVTKKAQETTMVGFVKKLEDFSLNDKDILNSNLDSSQQLHFLRLNKARLEDKGQETQGAMAVDLFHRIYANEDDPNKITDEHQLYPYYENKTLSYRDLQNLRGELSGSKSIQGKMEGKLISDFLASQKSSITNSNPLLGKTDNIGDVKYGEFRMAVQHRVEEQRKAGKPIGDLFDQSKPGNLYQMTPSFQRSMDQQMKDLRDSTSRSMGRVPTSQPSGLPSPAMQQFNAQISTLPKTAEEEAARNAAIEKAKNDRIVQTQRDRMNKQKAIENDSVRRPGETIEAYSKRVGL